MSRPENDRLITVQDVYNVIQEHLGKLDTLWPEAERFGPRKVHIVELIDGIKLRLVQKADQAVKVGKTPFQQAAERIMGPAPTAPSTPQIEAPPPGSPMEEAHRAAKARMAKYRGNPE